jgi:hypothetical protein
MLGWTEIELGVFQIGNLVIAAIGATHNPVVPADGDHEITAILGIGEVFDGFE